MKTLSHGYELTGIVRNLSDGRVELVVEGERQELKDFLQAVCDSEVAPFIKQVESKWDNAANQFRGFEIAR